MRTAVAILLFVVCCYSFPLKEYEYENFFAKWTVMHSKTYDVETFFKRYSIFKTNVDYVNTHNAKNASYEMEMNRFGDLTFEEFSANYKGLLPGSIATNVSSVTIPSPLVADLTAGSSLDWRNKNAVNPIRDQGGCGSCWAFSAIASVEGAWAIKKSSLIKLSEQQLVDCNSKNGGCAGGAVSVAFQYIINKGIGALSKYPYANRDQSCKSGIDSVASISKFTDVNSGSESGAMMNAVNIGPISISIAASKPFQFYSSGVLDDSSCGTNLDHAVNVIGYGTAASGKDYWIVRNS